MRRKTYSTKKASTIKGKAYFRYVLLITLITLTVYLPSLNSDFVNWDDETYIAENVAIQNLSLKNIKTILQPDRFIIGNYHPLTEFSFAVNFFFSGLDPMAYKATNILLHLFNTILVFFFFYRFSNRNVLMPSLVALLFSIHPMHVESVSWISERKDLLYTFFYLLGLISYLSFSSKRSVTSYLLTLIVFVFSLLAKAQAVTFPLVLILLHLWHRKIQIRQVILNLLPFLTLSLLFGLLAIRAQDQALSIIDLNIADRLIVGSRGLIIYLVKSLVPYNLSALHPYPQPFTWPSYYWLFPLGIVSVLILLSQLYRRNRTGFFGLAFFLVTILPVLQFLPVGMSMHAERYTYLPYLGLFFIYASAFDRFINSRFSHQKKILLSVLISLFMVTLGYLSYHRTKVWQNSEGLWKDVISKYPGNFAAYLNLTYSYLVEKKTDLAIKYADQGIRDAGHNVYLYDNKSYAYLLEQKYSEALEVLDTALKFVTPDIQFYINQGDSYTGLDQMILASQSYSNALKINPHYLPALLKRAQVYLELPDYHLLAIEDLNAVLAIDSTNIDGLASMAKAQLLAKDPDAALRSISRAIDLDPGNTTLSTIRESILRAMSERQTK